MVYYFKFNKDGFLTEVNNGIETRCGMSESTGDVVGIGAQAWTATSSHAETEGTAREETCENTPASRTEERAMCPTNVYRGRLRGNVYRGSSARGLLPGKRGRLPFMFHGGG
jgi:hypothetical protein